LDVIEISGLRAHGRHGASPGERDRVQPFDVHVRLETDLRAPQDSDDLADTIDYDLLHRQLCIIIKERSYALLERLAGALMDEIFRDARVSAAEVSISKLRILDGATPAVMLRRKNPRFSA